MNTQNTNYDEWIGRTESCSDIITAAPVNAMAALLDREVQPSSAGDDLPPLWHWLYFLNPARQSKLAIDGHPQKGDFLPPTNLPRRMWAGSRLSFHQDLHVGDQVTRKSTIKSISSKEGSSGQLLFVCVNHEISTEAGIVISEEHDIVYRDKPSANGTPPNPKSAPKESDFHETILPDPVFLFRYSALTFNGHRIHYDRDYVTRKEGYPGLVVHGPLLATLLIDLVGKAFPERDIEYFEFKALHPVFDLNKLKVCGNKPDAHNQSLLWIQDHNGALCMKAKAILK